MLLMMHYWLWICIILSAKDGNGPFLFLVFWSVQDISAHPTKGWVSFVHCAGIQGSSSARRKCREEGFKGQQKFILQANKNLGRNRIDTLETVKNVVLLGNIFLHPGAPHRRKSGVCHVIPTIGTHPISLSIHSLGFKQLCFFNFFGGKSQCGVNKY